MGIIYELYFNCIRGGAYKRQDDFVSTLFPWIEGLSSGPAAITGFINYDYIPNASEKKLKEYSRLCVENYEYIAGRLRGNLPKRSEMSKLNEELIKIASNVTVYGRIRIPRKDADYNNYSSDEKNRLLAYLLIKRDSFDLIYNIYLLMTFAISKRLPENFTFGIGFNDYLNELNREVTCMYGITSNPGIARLINMADRKKPNPFAVYSYADLLYYGRYYGVRKNLDKCYKYYRYAAGLDGLSENDPDKSFCHPLALFSVAHLLRYYEDTDESNFEEYVHDIQIMSITERYDNSTKYCMAAFTLSGNEAAANVLGQIAALTNEQIPGIEEIKKRYQLKDDEYYFHYAADHGYMYATNNLAMKQLRLALQHPAQEKEYIYKYIDYLKRSAEKYEPWSLYRLGDLYRSGELTLSEDRTICFPEIVDKEKAFGYYKRAITKINNIDSAWAYAHLVIDYPEKFLHDIKLLNKYIKIALSLGNPYAIKYIKENFKIVYNKELPEYD